MVNITEKIKEIEAEMARTQKNKATGELLNTSGCPREVQRLIDDRVSPWIVERVSGVSDVFAVRNCKQDAEEMKGRRTDRARSRGWCLLLTSSPMDAFFASMCEAWGEAFTEETCRQLTASSPKGCIHKVKDELLKRPSALTEATLDIEKLARLRAQLLEPGPGAGGAAGSGFDVSKSGDARIALVGFPSVGKSTFLSKITKTRSEVAAYSFTTLTAIPGVLEYGGAEIQILDLPGIIEGASEGKGRGRQVISAAKTSDLILMILDATKRAEQRTLLSAELEAVGIRLNRSPPNIYLKQKKAGGMKITFQSPPQYLDEKMLYNILRDYKMLNVEVLVRDDHATVDDFIDVIMKDHRKYIRCLYVYNKIDSVSLDFLDELAREPNTVVMSCELDLGVQDVVDRCWEELRLMRIYTKRQGVEPDFGEALIVRNNSTVEDVCDQIHRTLKETFKYALVWGASAKHVPQRVGLGHPVSDEDVVQVVSAWKA